MRLDQDGRNQEKDAVDEGGEGRRLGQSRRLRAGQIPTDQSFQSFQEDIL